MNTSSFLLFLFLLSCVTDVFGDISQHEIFVLPGADRSPLPSRQYSGFIDIGENKSRHIHYWFIVSEGNPVTDPVVAWFNGGPGASSVWGALAELGPFRTNDDSLTQNTTKIPKLFYNEWGWQRSSNLLFVESPAGVGYSYCDGPAGPVNSCPLWNDDNCADDNYAFLQAFFTSYSEYKRNDFFISGESYAGVYIPMMTDRILKNPGNVNLKGLAVGNACMGFQNPYGCCGVAYNSAHFKYLHRHSFMSNRLYNEVLTVCGDQLKTGPVTPECIALVGAVEDDNSSRVAQAMGGFNVYSIYDMCYLWSDNYQQNTRNRWIRGGLPPLRKYNSDPQDPAGTGSYKCGSNTAARVYLNLPEVKTAFHVQQFRWADHDGWDRYTQSVKDVSKLYPEFLKKIDVMIYHGDLDSGVPINCAEEWIESLNYPVAEEWRPWTIDGQTWMGGYVTTYAANKLHNLTFVTVRGVGHMVPQFKPFESLEMITRFLRGQNLKTYNGSALQPPHCLSSKRLSKLKNVVFQVVLV